MKQKINIKKIIEEHSDIIVVGVSGVSIIVAYALGHKIGRGRWRSRLQSFME